MKRQLHYINIQLPRIILIISSSIPIGSTGSGTSASPRKLSSPAPPPKSSSSSSSISPPQKQQTNIIQHTKKVIPSGRQPSVHTLLSSLNSMAFFIDLFQFSMTLSLAVIYKKIVKFSCFQVFLDLHVSSTDQRYGFHQIKIGAICTLFNCLSLLKKKEKNFLTPKSSEKFSEVQLRIELMTL